MRESVFSIAAVERDVGLSKDVLRVWERRYGFPAPTRDPHGERLYDAGQVARLRVVKRLMDQGFRPGRLLRASDAELAALTRETGARAGGDADAPRAPHRDAGASGNAPGAAGGGTRQRNRPEAHPGPEVQSGDAVASPGTGTGELLALIGRHDATILLQALRRQLARAGLRGFVQDTVAPLTAQVGHAWQEGRLQVHEEHLFTEQVARVLREAIAAVPDGDGPRTLLTTVPNEPHALGLLMLEALLALEGARCIALGTQLPLLDIAEAARAYQADVVALSFSAAFPRRQVLPLLQQLRGVLPQSVCIWAGGAGVRPLRTGLDGVVLMTTLHEGVAAVRQWRRPAGDPTGRPAAKAPVSSSATRA